MEVRSESLARLKLFLLVGMVFFGQLLAAGTAQATPLQFYNAVDDTFSNDSVTCNACHTLSVDSLTMDSSKVPIGSSTVQATLKGIDETSYSWFYRVDNGTARERVEQGGTSVSLQLGSSTATSFDVDYCIAQGEAGVGNSKAHNKGYNCSSMTVTRVVPNADPVINTSPIADVVVELDDGSFTRTISATDSNDDTLTYSSSVTGSAVSVSGGGSNGSFTITPSTTGDSVVTLTVSDGEGGSDTDSFDVTVRDTPPDNNAPEITSNQPNLALVKDDTSTVITVNATDEEGDTLEYSASVSSSNSAVSVTGGGSSGTFKVFPDNVGSATVTLTVSDGDKSDSQQFSVTVGEDEPDPVDNSPPTIFPLPDVDLSLELDIEFGITINASDTDGDTLSYSASSSDEGVLTVEAGVVSTLGRPTLPGDFVIRTVGSGSAVVTFSVTDNEPAAVSVKVSITVKAEEVVDTPPVISEVNPASGLNMLTGDQQTVSLAVSDDDSDSLTYDGFSNDVGIATVSYTGNGVYSVTGQSAGTTQLTLRVTDSANQVAETQVTVSVTQGNQAPVAVADTIVVTDAQASVLLAVTNNDNDSDGDALTVRLVTSQSVLGGSLVAEGDAVRYTPPSNFTRDDSFEYSVADAGGLVSETVTVTLRPSDTDGDGVFDSLDNCILLPNSDQLDMDTDDIGDICDSDPDGDGIPGISGEPLPSGRDLVEAECLLCHNNPSTGAPQFNDQDAWAARIAKGDDVLIDHTINGFAEGAMPAFGSRYSATELTAAVLYLSGQEGESGNDRDLDTIADPFDNCVGVPNTDQLDSDGNEVGDVCEPTADNDGDGYTFSLDDDDGNANRLPGRVGEGTAPIAFFFSEFSLSLGTLGKNEATFNNNQSAGVIMEEEAFLAALSRLPVPLDTQNARDTSISSIIGVINIKIQPTLENEIDLLIRNGADLLIKLDTNLPLQPVLRTYPFAAGSWTDFSTSENARLLSAPAVGVECPPAGSPNYSENLQAGLSCMWLQVIDGGANDADGVINGQIELILAVGSQLNEDGGNGGGPETVDTSPSKSSGGSVGIWFLLLMVVAVLGRARFVPRSCLQQLIALLENDKSGLDQRDLKTVL